MKYPALLAGAFLIIVAQSYIIYRLQIQKRQIAGQSRRLETLLRELHHRVKNNLQTVELRIEVRTELLDIEQALPIGLIVNELVTNAFKYAYLGVGTPALLIRLEQRHSEIVLEVKDNGIGIDVGQWKMGRESFGKQLIRALCRQLRATQQLRAEEGTEFRFMIPRRA